MTKNIIWNFECNVRDGKLAEFRELANELVSVVNENEPNTLIYEWWIAEDEKSIHFVERFADSAAALTHLGTFGTYAERFMACMEPTRVLVYGDVSDELKAALKDFGPNYFPSIVGPGFKR